MYKTIYVPVDNSDYSNVAIDLALNLGAAFRSSLVGSHVYAAKLHDVRFKQMEFTLPDEYKEETELEKQRKIHDALIGRGLHLISDSYLDQMDVRARAADLPFERKHFDGKNFEAITRDVSESGYDLVVLGALGQGAVKDSLVGSVVERLLRRTQVDTLVVRDLASADPAAGGRLLVCLDGSTHGYAALQSACRLAARFGKQVDVVTAVEAGSADAPLLRAHLEVARGFAEREGVTVTAELLDIGTRSVRQALTDHVAGNPPWLLLVGRSGADANGESPIGSVTEHLVRHASSNVMVCSRSAAPTETPQTA